MQILEKYVCYLLGEHSITTLCQKCKQSSAIVSHNKQWLFFYDDSKIV